MRCRISLPVVILAMCVLSAAFLGAPRRLAAQTAPTITSFQCGPTPVLVGQETTCAAEADGLVLFWQFGWDAENPNIVASPVLVLGAYAQNFTFLKADTYVIAAFVCTVIPEEAVSLNTPGCAVATTLVNVVESAGCQQWDITGTWQTAQGNGYHPAFAFAQSGTSVTGTATLPPGEAERAGFTSATGTIAAGGALTGDQLDITVDWPGRAGTVQGRYTATVSLAADTRQGSLVGDAGGTAWTGTGPLACAVP